MVLLVFSDGRVSSTFVSGVSDSVVASYVVRVSFVLFPESVLLLLAYVFSLFVFSIVPSVVFVGSGIVAVYSRVSPSATSSLAMFIGCWLAFVFVCVLTSVLDVCPPLDNLSLRNFVSPFSNSISQSAFFIFSYIENLGGRRNSSLSASVISIPPYTRGSVENSSGIGWSFSIILSTSSGIMRVGRCLYLLHKNLTFFCLFFRNFVW